MNKAQLRSLVEHPNWRLMPGMLLNGPGGRVRVREVRSDGTAMVYDMLGAAMLRGCTPVLDDEATSGCLFAMLTDWRGGMADRAAEQLADSWHAGMWGGEVLAEVLLREWEAADAAGVEL
jgi:hypothetical protein